ncbi:MAG: hypothetical protein L6Q95_00570 [Planctomycetes bacterium]|nr:hypothetical protein [Planctomycetota bacterium]
MKRLLVASVVALVLVGGLGIYSLRVLGEAARRAEDLDKAREAASKALLETDDLFPHAGPPRLDPARFPVWLEVRGEVARHVAARVGEPSANDFHTKETVNDLLGRLREELLERKMAFSEYRATARRWRQMLALPEFEELRAAWRERTATRKLPEGIALPAPAADAEEKELEQIRRYAPNLRSSMDADLLDPVLDGIGKGPGEG